MNKSTITRERLEQLADNNTICKVSWDERIELAQIALAAMDSEPDCKERKLFCSTDTTRMRKTISVSAGAEDAPLYRHAQQPVVSAELLHTAASAIEDLLTTKDRMGVYVCFDLPFRLRSAANAQPAPVAYSDFESFWSSYIHPLAQDDELKDFAWDIWNACRAAILAAAKHDTTALNSVQSVATVPGTWIPVSERLPEAGGDMIVFTDGIVMSGVSYAKKKGFYIQALEYDDDEPVDSVTHWMPLPAAPQEVK
ncbi:hypothetical protein SL56_05172 [Klebsiella pneumoniae]|nr:DUF551 domain-containing protein [Klebsiella pneumoniae]KMB30384.1 hypothetical protein SL56_05172 [Klebsiella pneumoniae]